MRSLLVAAAIMAAAVLVAAGAVQTFDDRATLVPPPGAVAEEFVRALAAGRFSSAGEHLDEELRHSTGDRELRALAQALETPHGPIRQVQGRDGAITATTADATATLTFADRQASQLSFRLAWREGTWKITDLGRQAGS